SLFLACRSFSSFWIWLLRSTSFWRSLVASLAALRQAMSLSSTSPVSSTEVASNLGGAPLAPDGDGVTALVALSLADLVRLARPARAGTPAEASPAATKTVMAKRRTAGPKAGRSRRCMADPRSGGRRLYDFRVGGYRTPR